MKVLSRSCAALALSFALSLSYAAGARADEEAREVTATSGIVERSPPEDAPRPWLYLDDARVAAPLHVTAMMRGTYTDASSPTRPFGANTARYGGAFEAGAEVGLIPRLGVAASGFTTPTGSTVGAMAGVRVDVLPRAWERTHAVVSLGYLRELGGGNGAWARVSLTQDAGPLRVGTTVHGEHVFAEGRDAVDVMVMLGASVRVVGPLRLGVEYVAQDLEGAFDDDEAEAGVRHFVGPTGEIELLSRRLSIAFGPALGLTAQSPSVVGRVALSYAY